MRIRIDYNNMMDTSIGERGISVSDMESVRDRAVEALRSVQKARGTGWLGWTELPYNQEEVVVEIELIAEKIRKSCENFVVLGIGGSALGPITVFQSLKHLYYNELPSEKRNGPRFYVADNVDPERMNALFDIIEPEKTVFNVITKSGATSETMSQYLIVSEMLKKKLGSDWSRHIVATTDEKKGNLIKLAEKEGFPTFVIPDGVGGRFSELCPVGLLPAAVLGIDVRKLLEGAAAMDERCKSEDIYANPALTTAILQYLAMNGGKNVSVMMPYSDALKSFADWYCQLWGESLGKSEDRDGNYVYAGQTPVKSLGATDQHSQLQLYTEGPFDKVVTFIGVEEFRNDVLIPEGCEEFPDVHFLSGNAMSRLINTEMKATAYALSKAQRMNMTVTVDKIDEFTVGGLLYLFEMQTAYAGELLNVDAYNQPGVEEGKNATYAMFGRRGYEEKRKELENASEPKSEFIID